MTFNRFEPEEELRNLVECYWIAEDDDPTPVQQKIIPDGFPEIIFHYRDPYRIKLKDRWEHQSMSLFAGQITKYFYLANTGRSGMVGIKFKPSAISFLLNLKMSQFTDTVFTLSHVAGEKFHPLEKELQAVRDHAQIVALISDTLRKTNPLNKESSVDNALKLIFSTHGMISVTEICNQLEISERQLQRLFNDWVGLSPKFYARVIRFNYIFQLAQDKKLSWSEVGLESGFYDQSHFIRNFKSFTGEDPTHYFFDKPNLANFFLNKN